MSGSAESVVRSVMQQYGIPDYIWYPIARAESGLNPFAVNNSPREISKGIFQINVRAHPEYAQTDLYNPETNAEIAARTFILPAYNYAKTVTTDPKQQALIVYSGLKNPQAGTSGGYIPSGGIRPKWSSDLMNRFTGYFNDFVSGGSGSVSAAAAPADSLTLSAGQSIVKVLIIIGISIAGLAAFFSLFKDSAAVQIVTKGAKAAVTKQL
jgi:hypothetical protein